MSPTRVAVPNDEILEKDWQRTVIDLAKQLGWQRIYHTFNSRRSTHGFPDLVLIRERIVYLELKREKTHTTEEQRDWLRAIRDAGGEVYIARPSDLEALSKVLATRGAHVLYSHPLQEGLDRELGRSQAA